MRELTTSIIHIFVGYVSLRRPTYLFASALFAASCVAVAMSSFAFLMYSDGLVSFGPEGALQRCRDIDGSGADSDIAFFALCFFAIPGTLRVALLDRKFTLLSLLSLLRLSRSLDFFFWTSLVAMLSSQSNTVGLQENSSSFQLCCSFARRLA